MQERTPREPRRPWTDEDTATLMRLWSVNSPADIGMALGRSEAAVVVKASRIGLPDRNRTTRPGQARQRRCLMCNSIFHSTGPENQICSRCKESEEWNSSYGDTYSFGVHPTTKR